MRRLAPLLVAAAVLASAGSGTAGAAQPPLRSTLRAAEAQVGWTNLTVFERRRVLARLNHAPRALDELLARVAPALEIHRTRGTELAMGNFTELVIGGDGPAFRVNLSAVVLWEGGHVNAHVTLHELGHAVEGALGDDAWREAFAAALARSPAWVPCWPMPPGSSSRCVRLNEILADQFAFWATGRRGVRSSYGVPALLPRAQLGARFARLAALRSPRVRSHPEAVPAAPDVDAGRARPPRRLRAGHP